MALKVKLRNTIICILGILSSFCFAQKEKFLVAKYSFNHGNANDDLGKHHAKAYGALSTTDRFGNFNSAYYLHGNYSSFINLGTSMDLKPKAATVSMWFRIDFPILSGKGVEINPILLTKCAKGSDFNEAYGIGYNLNTHNVAAGVGLSKEKQVVIYNSEPISLRVWHHAVLCYDNKIASFYLDGKEIGTLKKDFESKFLESDSLLIGNRTDEKNVRFFNGAVDDIEIYNTVLTKDEILELYHAPNPNHNAVVFKWVLLGIAIALMLLISVWLIRRRIDYMVSKEKERNQLMNFALEQEIKMLKAQMDPHFMFNALNTILQFIVIKENEKAELYLTKFSKLIRKLLESNTQESVSLFDELDLLKKYLEIESMRFDEVFEPVVQISENIDPEKTFIPHMLIQPFVENAIWHGLRLKEGEKRMLISFERINEKALSCVIDDNGVGRSTHVSELKRENRSLAIGFIRQRLELMSRIHNYSYSVDIVDKVNEKDESNGTRVEMTIPILKRKEHDTSNFN